jgi:hypothetical protein
LRDVEPAPSQSRANENSSTNIDQKMTPAASQELSDDGMSELDTEREEELAGCWPIPDTEPESEDEAEDEESIQNRFKGNMFFSVLRRLFLRIPFERIRFQPPKKPQHSPIPPWKIVPVPVHKHSFNYVLAKKCFFIILSSKVLVLVVKMFNRNKTFLSA